MPFYILLLCYYHVQNNIQPILDDWSNQRCNPAVIPFAGMINAPTGESALQFTGENFEQCTQTILGEIAQYAFMPIYYLLLLAGSYNEIAFQFTIPLLYFDSHLLKRLS